MRRTVGVVAALAAMLAGFMLLRPARLAQPTSLEPAADVATGRTPAIGASTFAPTVREVEAPRRSSEPSRPEAAGPSVSVAELAAWAPEPKLSMRFDRASTAAALLRVVLVGGGGSPVAGELAFEVDGVPRRIVELRGRGYLERRIEVRVPARASVRVLAALDGLVADPLVVSAPGAGEWVEASLPLSIDPRAAPLELLLVSNEDLDGTAFLIQLHHELEGALRRELRAVSVENGRLLVGSLPAGSVALVGQERSHAEAGRPGGLTLAAEAQLVPGERALVRTLVEPGGSVRVLALGGDPALADQRLETELRLPSGLTLRPSWRSETSRGTELPLGEPAVLVPSLPPGAATLILHRDGLPPLHQPLWIRAGEIGELRIE